MLTLVTLLALGADAATGSLSRERVAELLAAHDALHECFEAGARGEVRLGFTITPDGDVREPRVLERRQLDEVRASCVRSALERLRFPMTRGATTVEWTFPSARPGGGDHDEPNGLEPAQLTKPVVAASEKVRECYEAALKDNTALEGRLVLAFVVAPNGLVLEVSVEESSLRDVPVERCVQRIVLGLRFPKAKNGKTTEVAYPFVLTPKPEETR